MFMTMMRQARKIGRRNVRNTRRKNTWNRLAATFLMLWWGGLNCLSVCAIAPSAPDHCSVPAIVEAPIESGDDHHCCVAAEHCEDTSERTDAAANIAPKGSAPQPVPHLECCALENHQANTEPQSRNSVNQDKTQAPRIAASNPDSISGYGTFHRSARLPDRGGTHLRICVFRI
jgi:hypothetical protein